MNALLVHFEAILMYWFYPDLFESNMFNLQQDYLGRYVGASYNQFAPGQYLHHAAGRTVWNTTMWCSPIDPINHIYIYTINICWYIITMIPNTIDSYLVTITYLVTMTYLVTITLI